MNVDGKEIRSIWLDEESDTIRIIDQRKLPHRLVIERIDTVATMVRAIREDHIRGSDLLHVAAAYGIFLAAKNSPQTEYRSSVDREAEKILGAQPDSVGLAGGIKRQLKAMLSGNTQAEQIRIARRNAIDIANENVAQCKQIGQHGFSVIRRSGSRRDTGEAIDILTNGYAGGLACVDYGTATAPIYSALEAGIDIHVWLTESRPHMEGSRLTAWEFEQRGVNYTVVTDSAAGYLLQKDRVDVVLIGAKFAGHDGHVAGYTGTYMHALAAADSGVPFYAAISSVSIDWYPESRKVANKLGAEDGMRFATGLLGNSIQSVLVTPRSSRTLNVSHDVTPPRLITGLITDRGICEPCEEGLLALYPEKRRIETE